MNLTRPISLITFFFAATFFPHCVMAEETCEMILDFQQDFDLSDVPQRDAAASLSRDSSGRTWLQLKTGTQERWPGITLFAPDEGWDFSGHNRFQFEVKNRGKRPVRVHVRIDTSTHDGSEQTVSEVIAPGETKTVESQIFWRLPGAYEEVFFGMRGYPGGYRSRQGLLHPEKVTRLLVFVSQPEVEHDFLIDDFRLKQPHSRQTLAAKLDDDFFPMIDSLGQYKHKDWPGKVQSLEDLRKRHEEELDDLKKHPEPENRDRWGGWAAGPKRESTGFFRVEKVDGKWWIIDPDGNLFWSHGIDCVRVGNATTPITDREFYFEGLPEADSPFGKFYGKGSWAPHGYYEDKGSYRTYNFDGANLLRKHGEDWYHIHAELAHRRLRSWGMNTIANWSDMGIYERRKTPYTCTIPFHAPVIGGTTGYWRKFPDPFDPAFAEGVRKGMNGQKGHSVGDPWCLGYFVDNELAWKNEVEVALGTLASPESQPAKKVMLEKLREKYQSIDALNQAWETQYANWRAMAEQKETPEVNPAVREDLISFYATLADQYFRVIEQVVHEVAPNGLYLGCRFSNDNETAVRAAARYCDIISFNRYRYDISDMSLPEGVDRPIIIGEFHFGALDRGMFHTGLRPVADQQERAKAYLSYVEGALKNPLIVGTHWFQYRDQATTGRGDGENYQIGFVDVCDTPYPETIEAARSIGEKMYPLRYNDAP